MLDTGVWDDPCRTRLKQFLTDPRAVDALTLMFCGGHSSIGRDTISKFVDVDEYLGLVEQRLGASDIHESVRVALERAKRLPF
jgi:hypothetical protein